MSDDVDQPIFEATLQPNGQWAAMRPGLDAGLSYLNGWGDVVRLRREWAATDVWPGDTLRQFVSEFGEPPAATD